MVFHFFLFHTCKPSPIKVLAHAAAHVAEQAIEIIYPPGEKIGWTDVADQLQEPRGTPADAEVLEINGYRADGSYYSFTVWGSKKTGRITQALFDKARDEAGV